MLRAASQKLADAYAIKDGLRYVYQAPRMPFGAMFALRHWFEMAKARGIPEMSASGSMVEQYLKAILKH